MVDGKLVGIRPSFKTLAEAQGKAAQLRAVKENEGNLMHRQLSLADYLDAEAALKVTRPFAVTLLQCAREYAARRELISAQKTVKEVYQEFIDAKTRQGLSLLTVQTYSERLRNFCGAFGSRIIHEIIPSEIERYMQFLSGGAIHRKNNQMSVNTLFGFALARKYVAKNPVSEIAVPKVILVEPRFLTLPEVRMLLDASDTPRMRVIIALALLRVRVPWAEICRLDWSNIDFSDRIITIRQSKNTISRRRVRMSDNLVAWLEPHRKTAGPVFSRFHNTRYPDDVHAGDAYGMAMWKVKQAAAERLEALGLPATNLRKWPHDAMRHTFATYSFALTEDAGRVAAQMGHGRDSNMLFVHYRGLTSEADARAYFAIYPAQPFAVVQQPVSA